MGKRDEFALGVVAHSSIRLRGRVLPFARNKAAVAIEGIAFLAAVWVEGVVTVTAIGCIGSTVPLPVGIGVFRTVAAVGVVPLLPRLIPVGVVLN